MLVVVQVCVCVVVQVFVCPPPPSVCAILSLNTAVGGGGGGGGSIIADTGSIPRCGKGFFSRSIADSVPVSRQSPCAISCVNMCAHVKDPKH